MQERLVRTHLTAVHPPDGVHVKRTVLGARSKDARIEGSHQSPVPYQDAYGVRTHIRDHHVAAEVLDHPDADLEPDDLEDSEPFEEGDLALLADIGLPEAVLGVILDESDLYADEQLGRIAREMGFADQLASVIDRLGR